MLEGTLGAASYTQLLIARQQDQQNKIGLIAAQAQRLADTVVLYQALGGGYEVSDKSKPM
jgi:outer membrane protein TolC